MYVFDALFERVIDVFVKDTGLLNPAAPIPDVRFDNVVSLFGEIVPIGPLCIYDMIPFVFEL
jgi:hypothetical protein